MENSELQKAVYQFYEAFHLKAERRGGEFLIKMTVDDNDDSRNTYLYTPMEPAYTDSIRQYEALKALVKLVIPDR